MAESLDNDQIFIRKLTDIIHTNLGNDNFGVDELAHESGMSLYRLGRKLHSINKKTVNQFIREVRLQKALEMLQEGTFTAAEVAFRTGFGSPAYFNKRFHEFFGYTPGEAIKLDLNGQEKNPHTRDISKQENKNEIRRNLVLKIFGFLLLACTLVLIVFRIFIRTPDKKAIENFSSLGEKITVAVMPFLNMSGDSILDLWQGGLQRNLICRLTNSEEIKVRQTETVNSLLLSKGFTDYASITPSVAIAISRKLDSNVLIYGNIYEAGNKIRLNAELIDPRTGETFKSFQIDGISGNILASIDSLSRMVQNFLLISLMQKKELKSEHYPPIPTKSSDAYRYVIYGDKAFNKLDFPDAIDMYMQAIKIDSTNLYGLYGAITAAYLNQGLYKQAKESCLKAFYKMDLLDIRDKISIKFLYAALFETPNEAIRYAKQRIDLDGQDPESHYILGDLFRTTHQYDRAISEYEKTLEIYKKWDTKPLWVVTYSELGDLYHCTGQYKKEKKLYRKAEKDFPDDAFLVVNEAVLALALGDTIAANRWIEKYKSICQGEDEVSVTVFIAYIYSRGGFFDKAEEYYRKVLSFEPENPTLAMRLAYFLIDKDRNINEGLALVDKVVRITPDSYDCLHTKGWGLYKEGKYEEALKLLEKADSLKPIYNYDLYYHLGAAKKVVAGQR